MSTTAPQAVHQPWPGLIAAYRAGYTAEERRAVEGSLLQGRLRGVCATNALELGIDVGALDVTLHLGFPGNVASLWQQAGRAGRREQQALSILVAFDGPLDQYFMRHPKRLFERPLERASRMPGRAHALRGAPPRSGHADGGGSLALEPQTWVRQVRASNDA